MESLLTHWVEAYIQYQEETGQEASPIPLQSIECGNRKSPASEGKYLNEI